MVGVVKSLISHQTWLLLEPKRQLQLRGDGGYSLKDHLGLTMWVLFWRAKEWAYGRIKQVELKGQYDLKCNLEQSLGS